MRRQRLSSRENCLYHQEQSLEFLNHEAQLRLTAGLPPRINLHALPSTHTLPNESSWLQKWGAFKLKVALKDSFALFANWHTHILTRLDLLNSPGSHRMSTILCSCCFCECPCVCVCVWCIWVSSQPNNLELSPWNNPQDAAIRAPVPKTAAYGCHRPKQDVVSG